MIYILLYLFIVIMGKSINVGFVRWVIGELWRIVGDCKGGEVLKILMDWVYVKIGD